MSSSDSIDSDEGIRFKTDNVRNKSSNSSSSYNRNSRNISSKCDYKHRQTSSRADLRSNSPKRHPKSDKSRSRSHTSDPQNHRDHDKSSRYGYNYSRGSNGKRESDKIVSTSENKRDRKSDRHRSSHKDKYSSKEKTYEPYSSSKRRKSKSPHLDKKKSGESSRSHSEKKNVKDASVDSGSPSRAKKKLRNIEDDTDDSDSSDAYETSVKAHKTQQDDEQNMSTSFIKSNRSSSSSSREENKNKIDISISSKTPEHPIGPALPPHLQKKIYSPTNNTDTASVSTELSLQQPKNMEDANSPLKKEDIIGPALPPHLRNKSKDSENTTSESCVEKQNDVDKEESIIGPSLPSKQLSGENSPQRVVVVGPVLPPHLQKKINEDNEDVENEIIGPALPPHLSNQTENGAEKIIGPSIPAHLQTRLLEEASRQPALDIIDQEISEESDHDEEVIGPLPSNSKNMSKTQVLLEERALEMKLDRIKPKEFDKTVREEWMLELPGVQAAHLGLGPRQFRKNAAPDLSDRSSWTDTPEEKEAKKKSNPKTIVKKVDLKREAELEHIRKRDKEQEKMIEKLKKKKKRDKSLLDLHQDNLKKKKSNTPVSNERRPFNRETDLQVNKFDEAQKKAVCKKAQLLDTRFSTGESKFL